MATTYTTSDVIKAPVQHVWAKLTDVESMPEWTPSMEEVKLRGDARELGPQVAAVIRQPGMPRATWVVDDWRPMHSFSWTSRTVGVRTTGYHLVEPLDNGECRVTLRIEHRGPLASLIGALTMKRTSSYVDQELLGLKTVSERTLH